MGGTVPGFPTIYDPAHVCQFDGGAYQRWDCGPSSLAMLADRATLGGKVFTGEQVRTASGRLTQSGTNLGDLSKAWSALGLPVSLNAGGGSESRTKQPSMAGNRATRPTNPRG